MPIPKPKDGETQDEFIQRCMADETMTSEFPDEKQRYAVCMTQFKGEARENWKRPRKRFVWQKSELWNRYKGRKMK